MTAASLSKGKPMLQLFRPIPRLAPVVRSLAIASLLGTTFLAGSLGPVAAQTPAEKPPAAAAATSNKPDTVEQRITTLKTALKITADQEAKWGTVATAMRDNATAMEKLVQTKRAIDPASMTAVDDLMTYEEFTKVRLDGLKNLTSAFESLYNGMPTDQQKNADQVFMTFGSAPAHG
jgi:periplasmic protein CpxP/Spy